MIATRSPAELLQDHLSGLCKKYSFKPDDNALKTLIASGELIAFQDDLNFRMCAIGDADQLFELARAAFRARADFGSFSHQVERDRKVEIVAEEFGFVPEIDSNTNKFTGQIIFRYQRVMKSTSL